MTELNPGIFEMSEEVYRPLSMLNQSSIPHLLKSPAHYIANLSQFKSTPALEFGQAFHSYVLEPEKFKREYVIEKIDGRTIKGKQRKLYLEASNIKLVGTDDFECIKRMDANIKKHSIASKLLVGGRTEQAIIFNLKAPNGNLVKCKAKLDYLLPDTIVDLKNSRDNVDEHSFSRTIEKYHHYVQGAFYSHGINVLTGSLPDFVFIAVEDVPPYAVTVIKLSDDHHAAGISEIYKALEVYEKCLRENSWPSYPEKVFESKASKWLWPYEAI